MPVCCSLATLAKSLLMSEEDRFGMECLSDESCGQRPCHEVCWWHLILGALGGACVEAGYRSQDLKLEHVRMDQRVFNIQALSSLV